MKIIVVGGTGIIGSAVSDELKQRHDIIVAGRSSGDITVDVTCQDSIKKMFQQIGKVDAIVSAVGQVHFVDLAEMTQEKYLFGLNNKLMGQVNLVLIGFDYVNDKGSFTLTSGCLSNDPIKTGSSAAMVNGALDSFVKAASIEMPRGIRINIVSPTVIAEAMKIYANYFRGFVPVPAHLAAQAYSKSVEGHQTGQLYRVGW